MGYLSNNHFSSSRPLSSTEFDQGVLYVLLTLCDVSTLLSSLVHSLCFITTHDLCPI